MHTVVKLLTDDDGEKKDTKKWCLVVNDDGAERTFCTGECFGTGESVAKFKCKKVESGGITCKICLRKIKEIKAIKL